MIFIYGAASCGKSEYAENLTLSYNKKSIYLATMQVYDDIDKLKVQKHRRLRLGKGFRTVECPKDIQTLSVDKDEVILLECLSNLLANEIFDSRNDGESSDYEMKIKADKIYNDIISLSRKCFELIIVGNDVFSEAKALSLSVVSYLRALLYLQNKLISHADKSIEMVCGIPVPCTEPISLGGSLCSF